MGETRSFWFRKAQNFIIVIFGSIILILASLAIILGPLVWRVVLWLTPLGLSDQSLFHVVLRYALRADFDRRRRGGAAPSSPIRP